jgi:gamma-glutamyltranspeptidase/glutathione hydrolase
VDLSDKFGKIAFAELFEPAIDYARNGFLVTPVIAELWRRAAEELHVQPGFEQAFMRDGRAPRAGEIFQSEDFARTLEAIAQTKGESFYRGALAKTIVDFAQEHNAALSLDDMADHKNDWCGTISQSIGQTELHEIPPNGQGIAALMALGILRNTEIATLQPDSLESLHLQIEAMKLAFMDVDTFVSDPRFMGDVTATHLLDDDYLAARAKLIDRSRATSFPVGAPKDGGTVCLATGDAAGMMVSYIQSNYAGFGSGVVVPGTSISLQNRGAGFTLTEGHPNQVGPNKRPFHTIIPGMMMEGGLPRMAFGLMGGPIQAQGHLQMVLRTQVWGQDPQTAADAPRWRVVAGLEVAIEEGFSPAIVEGLKALGHKAFFETPHNSFGFGGAQLVQRVEGGYIAGSDPRKDGHAGGF